jgi:hypothetical protein
MKQAYPLVQTFSVNESNVIFGRYLHREGSTYHDDFFVNIVYTSEKTVRNALLFLHASVLALLSVFLDSIGSAVS